MAEPKKYDLVVFGASGFTGQFVVDEVARVADEANITWAVAGRNMEKLQKVLEQSSARTGKQLENTPIIIADSGSEKSLLEMAQQSKIVLNCVGPYRFYGEPVVKASIEGGASYVDISGEPQFLEKMQLLYNSKAKEENVYIIGACGFDSIPAEMGVVYTKNKFEGELAGVESYMSIKSGPEGTGGNYATYESAVHGFAHAKELSNIRKSLFPEPLPRSEFRMPKRGNLFYSNETNSYCMPFLGSDRSVVMRSVRFNYTNRQQPPIQFSPYFCLGGLMSALTVLLFGLVFSVFARFSITRSLLLKFPGLFTGGFFKHGGPSKKQIEETSFTMTFHGTGYSKQSGETEEGAKGKKPDKTIVTKITAPEPGYVTTPICMVQCAVVVLKEADKIPDSGGVLPPGAAFAETSLIDRLEKHGVKFEVVTE